ncbi:hypothetical protein B566_EDAN007450 [Ephemera danica]|nr:hypothetical protein B566_EDAN007450 [Ephemera danica]
MIRGDELITNGTTPLQSTPIPPQPKSDVITEQLGFEIGQLGTVSSNIWYISAVLLMLLCKFIICISCCLKVRNLKHELKMYQQQNHGVPLHRMVTTSSSIKRPREQSPPEYMRVLETRRNPFNVASTSSDRPGEYVRMGGIARRIASNISQRASYVLMGLRSSVRLDGALTDNSQ